MREVNELSRIVPLAAEIKPDLSPIRRTSPRSAHLVQFYEGHEALAAAVAKFLGEGMGAGDLLTVIATDEHRRAFQRELESRGFDMVGALASGQLVFLDADRTLSTFMRDGEPDPRLFESEVGTLVAQRAAAAGGARMRAYGEMVDVLWRRGDRKAAIRLEEFWNDLQTRHSFTLLCAYAMGSFYKEPAALHEVCGTHTHVGGEAWEAARDVAADLGGSSLLPQHAHALAREIVHREEVEGALRESLRELRRKEEALRQSEEELRDFVENAALGLHRVGAEGTILWANRAELDLLGYEPEEYIGRPISEFHADQNVIADILTRLNNGEPLQDYEARLRAKDGTVKQVLINSNACFRDGKFIHSRCLTRDITDRRKAEDEWKNFERFRLAATARTERLVKITAAVAEAVTANEVFEAVVDHVAGALGASSTALWLLEEDGKTVRLARSVGYADVNRRRFERLPIDLSPSIPALDAIRRGEPVWIASREDLVREYPHLAAAASGRSYRVCCLPLISQDRTLGALGITIEQEREVGEEERDFLLLVARYASQAIERVRLLDAERRNRVAADSAAARTSLLSRASRTFVDADLDLAPRLQDIVLELGHVLGSCVGIALREADGQLHTCAIHHPMPEAGEMLKALISEVPVVIGEGITGRVASTGESVLIPATDAAAVASRVAPSYRAFLERFPIYAIVCAPLRARGKVIGTVVGMRTRPGETYTREDLALLEELAERAAPAIENSRLHRENVAARSRAEQLYHFAKSVVSAERVEDVFEAALDAIEGALGTNRGAILTCDDSKVMRFRASRRLSEEYRRAVEGHSPWPPDATAPKPVLVPDVENDASLEAFRPLFRHEGIGSLAFVPLVTRDRLIGKFMVYYDRSHAYSTAEIELAMAIANHLASVTARFSAIAKLEETIRYNDLFSGVLAHDLRNPLGAIMTAAQLVLMRQEGAGDSNAKPLSRILGSGQRMVRMIDQLLDLTRARAGGGIRVEPCETNLADLCGQAIGEIELAYPQWKIRREALGDQEGSWDADRLLQIVSNLVSNAGQHGSAEGVVVVRTDGRQPDAVTLEVKNDGAIAESILPSLFDPFRGTRHRRDSSRGLGLGLFIVKEIVRAHGGTVDVTSTAADGTTFTVRMPRRALRSSAPGASSS